MYLKLRCFPATVIMQEESVYPYIISTMFAVLFLFCVAIFCAQLFTKRCCIVQCACSVQCCCQWKAGRLRIIPDFPPAGMGQGAAGQGAGPGGRGQGRRDAMRRRQSLVPPPPPAYVELYPDMPAGVPQSSASGKPRL